MIPFMDGSLFSKNLQSNDLICLNEAAQSKEDMRGDITSSFTINDNQGDGDDDFDFSENIIDLLVHVQNDDNGYENIGSIIDHWDDMNSLLEEENTRTFTFSENIPQNEFLRSEEVKDQDEFKNFCASLQLNDSEKRIENDLHLLPLQSNNSEESNENNILPVSPPVPRFVSVADTGLSTNQPVSSSVTVASSAEIDDKFIQIPGKHVISFKNKSASTLSSTHHAASSSSSFHKIDIELNEKIRELFCAYCLRTYEQLMTCGSIMRIPCKPYPCPFCKGNYYQKSSANLHMKVHIEEKTLTCRLCAERPDKVIKRLSSEVGGNNHDLIPSKKIKHKSLSCPLCSILLNSSVELDEHILSHKRISNPVCRSVEKKKIVQNLLRTEIDRNTEKKHSENDRMMVRDSDFQRYPVKYQRIVKTSMADHNYGKSSILLDDVKSEDTDSRSDKFIVADSNNLMQNGASNDFVVNHQGSKEDTTSSVLLFPISSATSTGNVQNFVSNFYQLSNTSPFEVKLDESIENLTQHNQNANGVIVNTGKKLLTSTIRNSDNANGVTGEIIQESFYNSEQKIISPSVTSSSNNNSAKKPFISDSCAIASPKTTGTSSTIKTTKETQIQGKNYLLVYSLPSASSANSVSSQQKTMIMPCNTFQKSCKLALSIDGQRVSSSKQSSFLDIMNENSECFVSKENTKNLKLELTALNTQKNAYIDVGPRTLPSRSPNAPRNYTVLKQILSSKPRLPSVVESCAPSEALDKISFTDKQVTFQYMNEMDLQDARKPQELKCEVCSKLFSTYDYIAHLKIHSKTLYKCTYCSEICVLQSNMIEHMRKHLHHPRVFNCHLCSKSFTNALLFRLHLLIHKGLLFICVTCVKLFSKKEEYELHLKTHDDLKTVKCEKCSANCGPTAIFKNLCSKCAEENENQHLENIELKHFNDDEPTMEKTTDYEDLCFECPYCDVLSNGGVEFKNHLSLHITASQIKCVACDKIFNRFNLLAEHVEVHKLKRTFFCHYCSKSFPDRISYQNHTHPNFKPYSCLICEQGLPNQTDFTVHILNHDMVAKSSCNFCGTVLGSNKISAVVSHKMNHIKASIAECVVCDSKFVLHSELEAHVFQVHETSAEEEMKCNETVEKEFDVAN